MNGPTETAKIDMTKMYVQAIERHHAAYDDLLAVIAGGGQTIDVVRAIIQHLDGLDVLGDWDLDDLRSAWAAAGGEHDKFPVVTLVFGDETPLSSPAGGASR